MRTQDEARPVASEFTVSPWGQAWYAGQTQMTTHRGQRRAEGLRAAHSESEDSWEAAWRTGCSSSISQLGGTRNTSTRTSQFRKIKISDSFLISFKMKIDLLLPVKNVR